MKLIVNGDDFGLSSGVNRGILEAHTRGILTSASLMVEAAGSAEAAHMARAYQGLGVGLHAVIDTRVQGAPRDAVERQLERFVQLTGQLPTHIDSHRDVHREGRLLPAFLDTADRYGLPLRGHCGVHPISSFYGRWDGQAHPEQVTPGELARILRAQPKDGFSELCCHPGYVDEELESSYSAEREVELHTLCERAVVELLRELDMQLATFREVPAR